MTDMTIAAIRITRLRVPWPDTPWLKGHAFASARNILVLDLETKGGIVGMGYLFSFRPELRTVATLLEDVIIPRVIGKDATAVEAIWNDLWKFTASYGRGGIATMAQSVLDIALWDAVGKRAGLPLHRLWGHTRPTLPVYGSGCFRGSGGDGMIAKALHYKSRGYKAIKMQMAHTDDLAGDVDNVRRMRDALGPDTAIMIDINMGWTADVAISQAVLRGSGVPDSATRPDARRPDRDAQGCGGRRHLWPDACAAPVPGIERAGARLDPKRTVDRGHGPVGGPVCRSGAGGERHDYRTRAARPRSYVQAGNS
jgi:L-alanine-DL-glutamate epimerase-like enolase superfamily enzyme